MSSCNCSPKTYDDFTKLEKFFENDGIHFKQLCDILRATEAVISGGTILCTLNNDNKGYTLSDVDIYVEKKNSALLNALLCPIFDYTKVPLKDSDGNIYYHTVTYPTGGMFNKTKPDSDYPDVLPSIVGLYNYTCKKKTTSVWYSKDPFDYMSYLRPYQIIVLEDGVKPKDFVKGFDLTFCMNYFDGETLVSYHPECVASRKGYVMKEVDMKTSQRIQKYEYRGYTIPHGETNSMSLMLKKTGYELPVMYYCYKPSDVADETLKQVKKNKYKPLGDGTLDSYHVMELPELKKVNLPNLQKVGE